MSTSSTLSPTILGGWALVGAGALNFLRNVVNGMSPGIDFSKLPATTVDDAVQAGLLTGWEPSHYMALVSVPLFAYGVVAAYARLRRDGEDALALAGAVGLLVTVGIFAVATLVDGLGLPLAARMFEAATPQEQPVMGLITLYAHQLACIFGGTAFAGFSLSIGLLGVGVQRVYGRRWFGVVSAVVSGLALVGYSTGLMSVPLRDGLNGVLAMTHTAYVLLIVLGVWMVREG